MATLQYMICCESGTLDRYTNCISAFNVLESVQLFMGNDPKAFITSTPGIPAKVALSARLFVCWRSEPDDLGREFEYTNTISFRETDTPERLSSGVFAWKTTFHRFLADIMVPMKKDMEFIRVRSGIRRKGSPAEDWLHHTYEIKIERVGEPVESPTT